MARLSCRLARSYLIDCDSDFKSFWDWRFLILILNFDFFETGDLWFRFKITFWLCDFDFLILNHFLLWSFPTLTTNTVWVQVRQQLCVWHTVKTQLKKINSIVTAFLFWISIVQSLTDSSKLVHVERCLTKPCYARDKRLLLVKWL